MCLTEPYICFCHIGLSLVTTNFALVDYGIANSWKCAWLDNIYSKYISQGKKFLKSAIEKNQQGCRMKRAEKLHALCNDSTLSQGLSTIQKSEFL